MNNQLTQEQIEAACASYFGTSWTRRSTGERESIKIGFSAALATRTPSAAAGEVATLSDEQITQVWQSMPGGPDGWLKQFGYIQFALAVLDAATPQPPAAAEARPTLEQQRAEFARIFPDPHDLKEWHHAQRKAYAKRQQLRWEGFLAGSLVAPTSSRAQAAGVDIEDAAKAIYRLFPLASEHPWVERGNSFKQDEARRYARAALAATPSEAAPAEQSEGGAGDGDRLALNKIRQLCNGGPFDLTDSPKSFIAQVRALAAAQPTKEGGE